MNRRSARQTRPSGFLSTDVIVGLALVAFMTTLFVGAMGRQHKAADRLADSRAATRLAEATLAAMQLGTPASDANVIVKRLEASDVPAGCAWVSVMANVNGRKAELMGLVKASSLPGGAR